MCSIAGYLGNDTERGRRFVERANRLMAQRGPDDQGVFVGARVVLGNRRLAILDLSAAGHQPMVSPDGRWVIVFNGEIYNHLALRARHGQDWQFKGHSDTETLLAVLSRLGPAVLEQMLGMWTFALWDAAEERLLLSRDRYGQKPLYWRVHPEGGLRFASEIKPLLEEGEKPECNPTAVAEFLALGNYEHLPGETFFRDIHPFPPGHWAWVSPGAAPRPHRYWRFPTVPMRDRRPLDAAAVKRFRNALVEAVQSQLLSDVTVGATLSGGLDSSSIVSIIATGEDRGKLPVFTAQAAGGPHDESPYVRAMEAKWGRGLDIHWTPLAEMRLQDTLRGVIQAQEEPFGDPSIMAHGFLMDAARQAKVPVILGGQGGDELLFGYPWMSSGLAACAMRNGQVAWASRELRQLALSPALRARVGLAAFAPALEKLARKQSRLSKRSWLSRRFRRQAHTGPAMGPASDIVALQLEAVEQVAIPHLTHYDDRNGMARSIECRMPFLDHRLAEVLAELEPAAFLSNGATKCVLRQAVADLLPQAVLERRDKVGFFTPLAVMIQREADWVRSLVLDDLARQLDFYQCAPIERCLAVCQRTADDPQAALRLWRCLAVRVWAEQFNVRPLV